MPTGSRPPRVVVVGGGIGGLAAAHALIAPRSPGLPVDVTVLEASDRPGGKLLTIEVGGLPVEAGADSFVVRKLWAVELCRELGLEEEVVIPGSWGAYVRTRRGLVPYPDRSPFGIPSDLGDLLQWQGLPRGPKLRALLDLVRPARKGDEDEALGSLLRRRLGPKASQVLVEPLLGGLHAGDPMRLSVMATFPELRDWEMRNGSLLRGSKSSMKAAGEEAGHKPLFATVWGGLSRLVDRLVEAIGRDRVRLREPALDIVREGGTLRVDGGTDESPLQADAVVLATPAYESSRLLKKLSPKAAGMLAEIPYSSTAVVLLAYPPGTASRLPEGTGFVVPVGGGTITACTWVSRKWPRDEFGDRAVVRCFVGRAGAEDALDLPDEELIPIVTREVEEATPLGMEPVASRVVRWPRSMPQYEVGHLERVASIEEALLDAPGIFLAGSAYRGVGIPDCIGQGREASQRVRQFLDRASSGEATAGGKKEISWTT
ncbi:MAG: protoporphyrinogen oxidase [Actinomycetota bacterium]